jgi:hypothetical protein
MAITTRCTPAKLLILSFLLNSQTTFARPFGFNFFGIGGGSGAGGFSNAQHGPPMAMEASESGAGYMQGVYVHPTNLHILSTGQEADS